MARKTSGKVIYHQSINLDELTFNLMHKMAEESRCNVSAYMRSLIVERAAKQQQQAAEHVA